MVACLAFLRFACWGLFPITQKPVRNRTVKYDAIVILPVHEFKAGLVEVIQPPVPHLGTGHCIHRQLLSCAAIRAEGLLEGLEIVVLLEKWQGNVSRLHPGVAYIENPNDALSCCCFYREIFAPNSEHN